MKRGIAGWKQNVAKVNRCRCRWVSRNDRPPNKDAIDCNAIAKDPIEGKIVFRMIYK
jgi:hypothetical protein